MFENLELTCHLTLFHDGWKPPDAASVCRENTQILQIVRLVPEVRKLRSP